MTYIWDILNEKTYNNKVGHYKFRRQFQFIISNSKNNYDKILDIAGGSGRFAIPLLDYSKEITVIDIDPTAIQILKERNSDIDTICGDFMRTEIQKTFSLIICIEALIYFQNWEGFFNKISTILTDDGRFIFTSTNPYSWRFLLKKYKYWDNGPTSYNVMNIKDLKNLLHKYNFQIEKVEGMNWIPLPLSSNSKFVSFFEKFEKIFGLKNWYSQSPLLLISIKKIPHNSL